MRHSAHAFRALAAAAAALLAAACDSPSAAPASVPVETRSVRIDCSGDLRARSVACAVPGATAGARGDLIVGGQGLNVRIVTGGIAVTADTFAFDLAVANLMPWPIGTTDGTTVDPSGVKVFLVDGVHTTQGTGAVAVANADGVDVFTAAGQPYFAYHQIIASGDTSAPRRWKLRFDPGVEHFTFSLLVSVPIPAGRGPVFLTIEHPTSYQVVYDTVTVIARIDSASASIVSTFALFADRLVSMPMQGGKPTATLNLVGLPFDTMPIRVRATTLNGDTGSVTVNVIRSLPPGVLESRRSAVNGAH
jgi:hypothetical protein